MEMNFEPNLILGVLFFFLITILICVYICIHLLEDLMRLVK